MFFGKVLLFRQSRYYTHVADKQTKAKGSPRSRDLLVLSLQICESANKRTVWPEVLVKVWQGWIWILYFKYRITILDLKLNFIPQVVFVIIAIPHLLPLKDFKEPWKM